MAEIMTHSLFTYGIENFPTWSAFFQQHTACGKIGINVQQEDFFGESEIHQLTNGVKVLVIRTTPGVIEKSEHSKSVYGLIYTETPLHCTLNGRAIALRSKDCLLLNGAPPFSMASPLLRSTVSVLLPEACFGQYASAVGDLFDGRLASTLPFGKLMTSMVAESQSAAALAEKISVLINLLIISSNVATRRTVNKFDYLYNLILSHCQCTDFSLTRLVQISGMSKRSIQYVFSQQNTRFQTLLLQARLARLLHEMQCTPTLPLSEIVKRCGYRSLLTASRHFREYYQESLSNYYINYAL
ncbi:hypothetical protein A9798_03015 [Edwardsiella hoshinae]|uniref:DNA-binding transcriptional activator FeaR n=1 Tax=Edwardsiella hoshinae TaxID=93378 RepID=A0A376D894_9GAMM|nr:helix-turn-helix domain-containing protein [Edwardsiella hoshinae]AOV96022.1 hypothetical protein A9798_03015 [Edwardsiella hoshinae]QPR28100.1 helix-turn-helix domain-containing protein [Edwardsiella hoshinae]STC84830.1 DNA-binding transcriptional activator FeaR [Edwardsiella hoshinae]